MAFRERSMEKLAKHLEERCPECKEISGVSYCDAFDSECAERKLGKGNLQVIKYRRPYGNYDTLLLCDGVRK